ncbi:hypothetical protein MtrunA17_Chr8g0352091 [Medicago truncatula]|uniref:Transmembrane protein n=1 Tax=Medicago truncatula TaxID=3880 RepID=A0A396GGM8_MEDTR|nr:hypothetical protein MtrunA17_Chr8g0352091 [Medicago truncatula]
MLQLFFTVAFSVVPLTLYIPPIRSLNLFVETMESVMRESTTYSNRIYPRLRIAWSRMLNCLLCNNTSMEISMGNLDKKRMERRKKEECEFLSTGQKTNYM